MNQEECESIMSYFQVLTQHNEKQSKIAHLQTNIWTQDLSTIKQEY